MATAAVLTRSNNSTVNDSFHSETLFSTREGTGSLETVDMGVADDAIGLVLDMLSDISADRGAYALREAYSNAYDAVRATGDMSRAIRIDIPVDGSVDGGLTRKLYDDRMDRVVDVTVSDEGIGMSPDDVRRFFLQYGGSKKRGDADSIGSKGLGSKAPLAVSDAFRVRTTKDGVTTTATIERRPDGNKATLSVAETGEPSGTTVTIPVSDPAVLKQMNEFAAKLAEGNLDATLYVNGERPKTAYPTKVGSMGNGYVYIGELTVQTDDGPVSLRAWESADAFPFVPALDRDAIDLNLCGVMYRLHAPERRGYYGSKPQGTVIVAGEPGFLNFTPSRDEVRKDAAREGFVGAIVGAIMGMDFSEAAEAFVTGGGISRMMGIISGNGGADCADISGGSYSGPSPVMEGLGSDRHPRTPLVLRWSGRRQGSPDFTIPASRLRVGPTDMSPLFSRAAHDGCGVRSRVISVAPAGMNVTTSCLCVPERAFSDRPNQGTFRQTSRAALAKGTDSHASLADGILLRDAIAACSAFRPLGTLAKHYGTSRISSLTVILGVHDGTEAGTMLRAESHFRTPVNAGKLSDDALYLMVDADAEDELPAWCRLWMEWMQARTLTLGEFLDEAAANRKAKQAASRKMREAEAKARKGGEELRKSDVTATLRTVTGASVLSTGEVLRSVVSLSSSCAIANVMDGKGAVGVIAGNFSANALDHLAIMATAILGRDGRRVRVIDMPRPTKAVMDALVDAGAVVVADERTNVKRRCEDTLVDRVRKAGGIVEFRSGEGYTETEKRENRCGAIGIPASMLGDLDRSAVSLAVIHGLDGDSESRYDTALSKALTAYVITDTDALDDAGRSAVSDLVDLCGGKASKCGIPSVKSVTRGNEQVSVRVSSVSTGAGISAYPILTGKDADKAEAIAASIRALAEVGDMFNSLGAQVTSKFAPGYYDGGSIDLAEYAALRSVIGRSVAEAINAATAKVDK